MSDESQEKGTQLNGKPLEAAFNYVRMRGLIGLVAIFIPIVTTLIVMVSQQNTAIPTSISVTYHLGARDVFVGMLVFVAAFLAAYNGHGPKELRWAKVAALCALGVAFFPTSFDYHWITANNYILPYIQFSDADSIKTYLSAHCDESGKCNILEGQTWVAYVHYASAVVLIGVLFFFVTRFKKRAEAKRDKPNVSSSMQSKLALRVSVYKSCRWLMIGSGVLAGLMLLTDYAPWAVMVVELGCLWGFGLAWFASGKFGFFSADENEEIKASDELDKSED